MNDVQRALESLPKGTKALAIAYDQAMQRIEAQKPGIRLIAQKALSWITYAKRLLSVSEIRYALGVQHGTSEFDEDNLYDIEDIVSACGGLAIVDRGQGTETVRLVHYSTQEFLRQTGKRYFPTAQRNIAVSCLTYLLYDTFQEGWWCLRERCRRNNKFPLSNYMKDRLQQHPLLLYAVQHWGTHASACLDESVRDLMMQFLRNDYKVSSAAEMLLTLGVPSYADILYADDRDLGDESNLQAYIPMSEIHLAACLGIADMVSMLLDNRFMADVRNAFNQSPLFWAALMGHITVVELLLSLNDIETDLKIHTPLSSAMSRDQKRGIQHVVLHENDILHIGNFSNQAGLVSQTTEDGTLAAVKKALTLSTVDVNCLDSDGNTPLIVAAERGHDGVVAQLLKSKGIAVNIRNKYGQTALYHAVISRNEAMVKILAARADVDVNIKSTNMFTEGFTPQATLVGHVAVVLLLLSRADIDVNIGSRRGLTPLMLAASYKYASIAKLLIAHHSIDVNCKDSDGRNALAIVAEYGCETMLQLLLICDGIDLNSKDKHGHTPLSKSTYGWFHYMRAYKTPLGKVQFTDREAIVLGKVQFTEREAIVKLLLTHPDVDIDCVDEEGDNLLSRVTKRAQEVPKPRLDGVIALLRTAMEDRSRAVCEG